MFAKSSVRAAPNPFFEKLAQASGSRPRWNFHKYVVARDGKRVVSFNTMVDPKSPAFIREIETLLLEK